ncbi:hypothetical protein HZB94_00850 [Candidatus Falkowbacteria bacterium]|nr:hypothetical protein [Candidatus Falkowbacteria bacterium]
MEQVGTIEVSGNYIRFQIQVAEKTVWFLTHAYPHADEILSAILMEKFGTEEFVQKYARDDVIRVGVMFDAFDEHHVPGTEKKTEECAATLVANALGARERPELFSTLRYVKRIDTEGKDHPQAIGALIKKAHKANRHRTAAVINWAQTAFLAKLLEKKPSGDFRSEKIIALLKEQHPEAPQVADDWKKFLEECAEFQRQLFKNALDEISAKADIRENIPGPHGPLKLVVIQSDNDEVSNAGRAVHNADITIQRRTTGNVHIFTDKRAGLKLFNLARMLRIEEQIARDNVVERDWRRLADEGMCPLGVWYYHHAGQFILNGSLTAQNVSPSVLSLERIVELTLIAVNPEGFEPSRQVYCQFGKCVSTPNEPCPWYHWGLAHCRQVRKGELERTGKITKEAPDDGGE